MPLAPGAVPRLPGTSDYVSVRTVTYRYTLCPAAPDDLRRILRLFRGVSRWLRRHKDTDQWARPWPDPARYEDRLRSDLADGKTWIVWKSMTWLAWESTTMAATITLDTEEPVAAPGTPVWPEDKRRELALYVRRVIVRRRRAHKGIGAALLDWAAEVAKREHGLRLIRVDVWTTNKGLHKYYIDRDFKTCEGRGPHILGDYPSQALFERDIDAAGTSHANFLIEEEWPPAGSGRWRLRGRRS